MNYHLIKATMKKFSASFAAAGVTGLFAAGLLMTPINATAGEALSGVIEAQYICHDGANRGTSVGLHLSLTKKRRIFTSTNQKGYYTATNCIDLSNFTHTVKRGTIVHVWYDDYFHFAQWKPCTDFTVRYVRDESRVWVQNGGSTTWNITCVAKYSL